MNYDNILNNITDNKNRLNRKRFYKFIENDDNFNLILKICKDNNLEYSIKSDKNYNRILNTNYKILMKILKNEEKICPYCNTIYYTNNKTCGKKECKVKAIEDTNIKKYGCKSPIQNKEIQDKIKDTNLKKYGVEFPLQSDKIREKAKKTSKEKYGFESPLESKEIQNKIKETNLKRYGVDNPIKTEEIQNKIKETIIEKYGVDNVFQNENIKEKIKQTNLEKYGVTSPIKNEDIKEKIKKTNLEKYGVEYATQNNNIKEKMKKTNLERYGFEYPSQNNDIKEKISQIQKNNNLNKFKEKYKNILTYLEHNIDKYINNNRLNATKICEDFNLHYREIHILYEYFSELFDFDFYFEQGNSKVEKEVLDYVKSIYNNTIIENDRKILNGKELDIYIPNKNFAIEFDGLYYHSYSNIEEVNKNYHINKTIECEKNNIHLFHIFENEWLDEVKKDIWKSKISIKLHSKKLNKLNGRDGIIKEIDSKIAKEFLNENHLQGYTNAKIKLGFFINNILYGVMTFGKSRFKKDEYELIRFSVLKYTIVRGLFSKFIKYFKKNYNINNLISYGNRRWTYKDNVYNSLMELESISKPNYFYVKNRQLLSRQQFQKHKLKNILEDFNPNKTELENMLNNKYRIIYDCGNYKYKL